MIESDYKQSLVQATVSRNPESIILRTQAGCTYYLNSLRLMSNVDRRKQCGTGVLLESVETNETAVFQAESGRGCDVGKRVLSW